MGEQHPLERTERAEQVACRDLALGERHAAVDLLRGSDQGIGIVLRAGGAARQKPWLLAQAANGKDLPLRARLASSQWRTAAI